LLYFSLSSFVFTYIILLLYLHIFLSIWLENLTLKLKKYINCKKPYESDIKNRSFKISIRIRTSKICFIINNGLYKHHCIVLQLFNLILVSQFPVTYTVIPKYLIQKVRNSTMLMSRAHNFSSKYGCYNL